MSDRRPVMNLAPSRFEKLCDGLALAGLLAGVALFARYWPELPESIPSHFNLAGQVDEWGSKSVFIIFPVMAMVMYGLILAVSRFPHTFNYPWAITPANAATQYRLARSLLAWLKACVIWMMAVLSWMTARTALGVRNPALPNALLILLGLGLIAGLAAYFTLALRAR